MASKLVTFGKINESWVLGFTTKLISDDPWVLPALFSSYVKEGLLLGQLQGNRFAVTLRWEFFSKIWIPFFMFSFAIIMVTFFADVSWCVLYPQRSCCRFRRYHQGICKLIRKAWVHQLLWFASTWSSVSLSCNVLLHFDEYCHHLNYIHLVQTFIIALILLFIWSWKDLFILGILFCHVCMSVLIWMFHGSLNSTYPIFLSVLVVVLCQLNLLEPHYWKESGKLL